MLTNLLIKCLSLQTISSLIAKCIARILRNASAKGGKYWDTCKKVIKLVNIWTSLFIQVYDDDTLTSEEEEIIADAIANQTQLKKVIDVILNS